jgi:hypothetical protein
MAVKTLFPRFYLLMGFSRTLFEWFIYIYIYIYTRKETEGHKK